MKQILAGLLTFVTCISVPALAEEGSEGQGLSDRWAIRAGGFFVTDAQSEVRLDRRTGILGTTIDFDETLNMETSGTVARIDGYYRFNENHQISLGWYEFNREGSKRIDREINFGDATFPVDVQVDSIFDLRSFQTYYQWSFYNVQKVELGVSGGLHFTDLDVGLRTPDRSIDESEGALAPLPMVGAHLRYAITPKLNVLGRWQVFGLEVGDYKGLWTDSSLLLEHRTFKHVGFGAGLNVFNFNIEANDDEFIGAFDTRFVGVLAYLKVY
jgi:hypothetical protein